MDEGFHVPVIPFGEVVLNIGAVVPVHKANVVAKSGVIVLVIVTFIVSDIIAPQILVADSVRTIVPVLPELNAYVDDKLAALEKVPEDAVHVTDCCPTAVPLKAITESGHALIV